MFFVLTIDIILVFKLECNLYFRHTTNNKDVVVLPIGFYFNILPKDITDLAL